ncbi:MAG: hypothetical protein R3F59_37785 [Myxococcota bacterium]
MQFTSQPSGAQVYEGTKYICTTPCSVDHPVDIAPLPREFVLRLDGWLDQPVTLSTLTDQKVELRRVEQKPNPVRPRPTGGGGEDILQRR